MSASALSSEVELSPEVLQLAARLGVADSLPLVLEMTRSVFPEAAIEVEAYQDHELADEWWIVFVVWHSVDVPLEFVAVTASWHHRLFECCPAHLASAFSIDTRFRS